jgi:hypothetical protein
MYAHLGFHFYFSGHCPGLVDIQPGDRSISHYWLQSFLDWHLSWYPPFRDWLPPFLGCSVSWLPALPQFLISFPLDWRPPRFGWFSSQLSFWPLFDLGQPTGIPVFAPLFVPFL